MSNVAPGVARHVPRPLAADGLARAQSSARRRRAAAHLRARRAARRRRCGGRVVDEGGRGALARARASGFSTTRPACGSYIASFKMSNRSHFVISAGACKHWVARALQVGERAVTAPSARDQAAAVCERVGAPPARDQAAARRQRGAQRAVTDAWFQVVEAVAKKRPSVCLMARLIIRHLIAPPAARGYLPGALRIFILFLPFVSSVLADLCRLVPWGVGACAQFLVACCYTLCATQTV